VSAGVVVACTCASDGSGASASASECECGHGVSMWCMRAGMRASRRSMTGMSNLDIVKCNTQRV
jgi:hypothetical protein